MQTRFNHLPVFGDVTVPVHVNDIKVCDVQVTYQPEEELFEVNRHKVAFIKILVDPGYPVLGINLAEEIFDDTLYRFGVILSNERVTNFESIIKNHQRTTPGNRWLGIDVDDIETEVVTNP